MISDKLENRRILCPGDDRVVDAPRFVARQQFRARPFPGALEIESAQDGSDRNRDDHFGFPAGASGVVDLDLHHRQFHLFDDVDIHRDGANAHLVVGAAPQPGLRNQHPRMIWTRRCLTDAFGKGKRRKAKRTEKEEGFHHDPILDRDNPSCVNRV